MGKLRPKKLSVVDQMKVFQLLDAMRLVHELCNDLGFPEILDTVAAHKIIKASVERGPKRVKEIIADAFNGSDRIQ